MPPVTPPSADFLADNARRYWRSLKELADTPHFRDLLERRFPGETMAGSQASRRGFLKLMGASLGLAGLTGCLRWPEEQLVPYAHRPADRTPGTPVSYPTAFELGGIGQGLLVTSCDGRPIKVEGNPSHPLNRGAADAIAQASVLEIYDPDRTRGVIKKDGDARTASSWQEFAAWAKDHITGRDGDGFCVLSEASRSPSVVTMRARLRKAMPRAEWFEYEALSEDNVREGTRLAFGKPLTGVLELGRAKIVVALDADLFGGGSPRAIKYARDFASQRRLDDGKRGEMNRLYVIESLHSITGACADERRAVRPGAIAAVAARLAAGLEVKGARSAGVSPAAGNAGETPTAKDAGETPALRGQDAALLDQIVADLAANPGQSVVVAGLRQPPEVHALVAAINHKLGNIGKTVVYYADPEPDRATHIAALRTLVEEIRAGKVKTLLILGGNPAYDAPADLKFAEALEKVPQAIHLALHDDETSRLCAWHLSRAHYLEAWGDVRTCDGTVSIVQPLIEPLFDGRSVIEVLALILGDQKGIEGGGHEIVRHTVRGLVGESFSEWTWKKALSEGVVEGTAWRIVAARDIEPKRLDAVLPWEDQRDYDLVFFSDGKVYDGRFANNGWLQELPEPMSRLTWDNAALMSPATAAALGAKRDEIVAFETDSGHKGQAPVFVLPGMSDGVIGLALGYGRKLAGNIGDGVGHDAYALRTTDALGWRSGVRVRPTGQIYPLATAQDHHIIDRVGEEAVQRRIPELIVEGTLDKYRRDPSLGATKPGLLSMFDEHKFDGHVDGRNGDEQLLPRQFHKWGMAVDLTACTGCGACVVACQAENNIPIVGKEQVRLGREMHWIRVDRYFRDTPERPVAVHQPVLCMHCENAPCESVCPVAATTHSQEGINMMTYNRCVGVRYCLNNCPYKVRRFNFFDYNRGNLKNLYTPNLLREEMSDLQKMQKNPDVTVRMRGVMEKCSYCIQRIEHARMAAKRDGDRPIREGEIQTACQQSCPAQAIVFGDLNDPESRVSRLFRQARTYGLLDGYLNTKPRTVYLAKVRNPASLSPSPSGRGLG